MGALKKYNCYAVSFLNLYNVTHLFQGFLRNSCFSDTVVFITTEDDHLPLALATSLIGGLFRICYFNI